MHFAISNTIATLFSLFVIGNSTSDIALVDQCPSFNYFVYILRRQCPTSVGVDLRCVIGLPGDVKPTGVLNCATVDAFSHAQLYQLTASEMLALTRRRDTYGRPWCMLTFFYSPHCVFSSRAAQAVFRLAPLFPQLTVVAVDVSAYSRNADGMIAQYGVLSTPLLALWENGYLVYRLYDDAPMNLSRLVQKVRAKTDLTPLAVPPALGSTDERSPDLGTSSGKEINFTEQTDEPKELADETAFLRQFRYLRDDTDFDWLLLASAAAAVLNVAYFALNSDAAKQLSDRICRRFPVLNFLRIQ